MGHVPIVSGVILKPHVVLEFLRQSLKNKASKNIKTIRTRVTLLILFASINTFPNLLSYKRVIMRIS